MKKLFVALVTLSGLAVSGGVYAAFADAPKDEAGQGQLEISGTLTNTNPVWVWGIPSDVKMAAADITLQKITGVVEGSNTAFALDSMNNIVLLEGYMKTPAPSGGAGLRPVITVGSQQVTEVCWTEQEACNIEVDALNSNTKVGVLQLKVDAELASAYLGHESKPTTRGTDKTLAALTALPFFQTTYPNPISATGTNENTYTSLSWTNTQNVSSYMMVNSNSAKLIVPTSSVPDVWSATLPITVTQK